MYAHGGSGNHGCEAIVRSTLKLLQNIEKDKILMSTHPEEDKEYGVSELCSILQEKQPYSKFSFAFLKAYLSLKLKNNYIEIDKLQYKKAIDNVNKGDIALSIGGDNYCYADVERYTMLHDMFLSRGAKTVLWGCSIEPELLKDQKIASDIKRYSLITARETISYEALKKINPNTVLVSDPAFALDKKETNIPEELSKSKYIGINLSPMIIDNEKNSGITLKNYENLLDYIIKETDFNIALIPHVVWDFTDDRSALSKLYDKFKDTNRIFLIEDQSCEKLKYIISKCEYFIGARTHSTIAAYSTCVPTLVVGYSVKAIGIAKDLFGTISNYVLPVQELTNENELLNSFLWMQKNNSNIKENLNNKMEDYINKSYIGYKAIVDL